VLQATRPSVDLVVEMTKFLKAANKPDLLSHVLAARGGAVPRLVPVHSASVGDAYGNAQVRLD
jgi:hypothetical protein